MSRKARGRIQEPAVQCQKQDRASPDKSQACGAFALVSKCLRCCGNSSAVLDEHDGERVDLMKTGHSEGGPQPRAVPLQGTSNGILEPVHIPTQKQQFGASANGGVEAGEGSTAAVNVGTQAQMAASLPGAEEEVVVHEQAFPLVVSKGKNAAEVLQNDSQAESLAGNTAEFQAFDTPPARSHAPEENAPLQAQGLGGGPFNKLGGAYTAMPPVTDAPIVMASLLHTWASASSEQTTVPNDIASLKESLTALSSLSAHTGLQHSGSGSYAAPHGSLAVEQQLSDWSQTPLLTAYRPSPQPLSKLGSKQPSGNPFAEPGNYIAKQAQTSAAGQNTMAEHLSFSVTATEQMGSFAAMPDTVSPKLFPAMSGNPFAEPSSPAAYQQVQPSYSDQPWVQPDASSASTAAAAAQMVPAAAMPAVTATPRFPSAPLPAAATCKTLSGHADLQAQADSPQTTPTQLAAAAEPDFIAAVYPTATKAYTDMSAGRSLFPCADWQQPETAVLQQADSHPVPTDSVTKWSSMPEQSLFSTSVEAQTQEMDLNSLLYSRQAALTSSQAARKWYLRKPFSSSMPSLRTSKFKDLHGSFHKLLEEEDDEPQVEVTRLSTVTEDMPTVTLAMHTPAVADRGLNVESSESSHAMSSAPSVTMPQSSRASEASCVSGRADLCLLRGQTGFTDKGMSGVVGSPKRGLKKLLKLGSLGRGNNDKGYGRLQETPIGASGITQQGMAEGKVKRRLSRRVSDLVAAKFGRSTSQDSGAIDSGITIENVSTEVGAAVDSATEAGLQSRQASAGISAPRRTVCRLSSLFSRAGRYSKADM